MIYVTLTDDYYSSIDKIYEGPDVNFKELKKEFIEIYKKQNNTKRCNFGGPKATKQWLKFLESKGIKEAIYDTIDLW